MQYIYNGKVCSDLETIKSFVENNLNILKDFISNTDTLFDINLILSELIVNGAIHGNECVTSKCINLTLKINNKKLTIEVEDEGKGIDYNLNDYNSSDLRSFGRGLVLVKGLSDEFYLNKNKVVVIKNIV